VEMAFYAKKLKTWLWRNNGLVKTPQ